MKFERLEIADVVRIGLTPHADQRGFFARLFCAEELAGAGLAFNPAQMSLSRNIAEGTLRGLHFQAPPEAEAKIVRAVRGAVFDVVVDLRPDSATYKRWIGVTLSAQTGEALLIPQGCAHGFLTLEPETDVLYQMDRMYRPGFARGLRYDDPAIGVTWPAEPKVVAPADLAWPAL